MYLVVPPGGCFPETRRIELGPGALTIGRADVCEIQVDVPGVDQEHAKISEVALIALGPDCAIGDVPLEQGSRRLLMPGDEIQIGSVVVALEGDDPSIDAFSPDNPHRSGEPRLESPRVRVVEGSNFGDELLLREENREYSIGRGNQCDLVIEDREVSREHVKLVRRGFTVFVMDLSSTRGSWLGRAAVYQGATVEWARPRMMRLGATVLSLEMPEAVRRAAPAAQVHAPMTPPPRTRLRSNASNAGSSPNLSDRSGGVPEPMEAIPASIRNTAPLGQSNTQPMVDKATQKLPPYTAPAAPPPYAVLPAYDAPPAYDPPPPLPMPPAMMMGGAPPGLAYAPPPPLPMPPAYTPPPPKALPVVVPVLTKQQRRAWKKTGPTIGRFSGLLLLALAGLAILGALFVVFSLLE